MKSLFTYGTLVCILLWTPQLSAQHTDLEIFRGNKAYESQDLDKAEEHYRNALSENSNLYKGTYNLGNTSYKKEDLETALSQYEKAYGQAATDHERANAMHNLGNTHMQSGKFEDAIEAYKKALRLEPNADDTRYNLSYAQRMLKQQQKQQENQDQDKQKNKEEEKEEDKNENKNEEDSEQENSDGQDKDEDKDDESDSDRQEKNDDQQEEDENNQKPQPKPINISEEQAKQMLEAAKNEDQQIQMELRKLKKNNSKNIDKDWWDFSS